MSSDFFQLSKVGFGRGAHGHVVFIDPVRKEALVSTDKKHSHPMRWVEPQPEIPEQPEQQDPETGEIIPAQPGQPAVEGGWQIEPDPIDGHTHDLEEIELKDPRKSTQDDAEIVSEVWAEWQEATELELESLRKGDEAEKFYFGEQWEATLLQRLRNEGRAAITKNFSQKYADDLCGVVREERKEFRYSPIEGGDKRVSDILSFVTKKILQDNYYQRERGKFFEDMVVPGKAVFNISVDFSEDMEGKIVIERFPWRDIKFGPFEKDDLCDLEYLTKDRLYSIAKVQQLWPDKADEVSEDFAAYKSRFSEGDEKVTRGDAYDNTPNKAPVVFKDFKNVDVLRKEIRVVERWRRIYIQAPVALCPDRGFFKNCYGFSATQIKSIKTIPGFAVINRTIPKMRITKIAGNVLLSDENPADLPVDDFFVAVGYCKRRDNKYIGKIELAKDSQLEINKRASQMIDIGNKMATYVHYVDDGVFVDETEKARFLEHSNTPGAVFHVNDINRVPIKSEGADFPQGIAQLMESAKGDLRELLNTTVEPWGANTTGAALQAEQRKVLRGNQFLFDSLEFAEIRLGRLLIPVIQRYYTPQRIARLVMATPGKEEIDVDGQPLSDFTQEDIEALLTEADLGKNDVEVTQNSYSPTTRLAVNMMFNDLAKAGYAIPPATIIRFSDLPQAEQDRAMQDLAAQSQAEGDTQSQTRQMEIEKSLLGQGIIPPSIKQEYQLDQATFVGKAAPLGGIGIGQPAVPEQAPAPAPEDMPQ